MSEKREKLFFFGTIKWEEMNEQISEGNREDAQAHPHRWDATAGKKTYQVNRMGVARTVQNIRLFKDLSVIDNIKVGLHERCV